MSDEDLRSDRIGRLPSMWRFRGVRRQLVPVREFGRDLPRAWSLHHCPTLPRWPDRLPGKLRYRLKPTRGTVRSYSDTHLGNFTIFKRPQSNEIPIHVPTSDRDRRGDL
jgi:hypothetical protein